jgi:hypothetical protein
MTEEQPEDTTEKYQESTAEYDSDLDDPEDETTGYENDADAEGEFAHDDEAPYEEVDEDADEDAQ